MNRLLAVIAVLGMVGCGTDNRCGLPEHKLSNRQCIDAIDSDRASQEYTTDCQFAAVWLAQHYLSDHPEFEEAAMEGKKAGGWK